MKDRLRELRFEKKMTQQEVAFKLNVSTQTVSKWERGLSSPSLDLIPKIAKLYCCSVDTLFGCDNCVNCNSKKQNVKNGSDGIETLLEILESGFYSPEDMSKRLKQLCFYVGREEYIRAVAFIKRQLAQALDAAEQKLIEVADEKIRKDNFE